jgi:hypothetical protein
VSAQATSADARKDACFDHYGGNHYVGKVLTTLISSSLQLDPARRDDAARQQENAESGRPAQLRCASLSLDHSHIGPC